ncbi:MAG: immunoglobulin domain-containing protein [Verrucomicrobiales bacterium]|nr:immunoglobulin domain-containing protein [Verrucomicrobiales bacterium]
MHPRSIIPGRPWAGHAFRIAAVLLAVAFRASGAYQAVDYTYPLRAGLRWEYDVANVGTVVREVGSSTEWFPGRTAWSVRTSLAGTLLSVLWQSTDAGLQLHRIEYPLDDASLVLAQPLTFLPATFDVGQTYQASVKAGIAVSGQAGGLTGDFGVSVSVEAVERVTVPAGTYDAVKVRVQDTEGTVETWWLARGVGTVKLDSNLDGRWELRSTTATPALLPQILQQPQSQSVAAGSDVVFSVQATGGGSLDYRWQKGEADLAGQNGATLRLTSVTTADAGRYRVLVSNADGSVTSAEAVLTVQAVTPPAELRLTSVRAAAADRLEMRYASEAGRDYRIEASEDLRVWAEVGQSVGQDGETLASVILSKTEARRFFRVRLGAAGGGTAETVSPVPGQIYPGGTRMGGALFGIEFTIPDAWKGGMRVNTPTLVFGSDTLPGLILGTLGLAWTREDILADEAMRTGFEMDVGQGGAVRFQPIAAMQDLGNNRLRHAFSGFDQAGQGYWLGIEFVMHPDGGFMMFVGATTTGQSDTLKAELIRFADTVKTTHRPTNRAMIETLSGRSYQWAGESSDWYNGNLNGSASLSSWSEKFAFFCSRGTIEINTKSTGYASTSQSGGWSSTYMSLSYDSSTTEYGQFTIVTDPQYGDVMILATMKGYQVSPVRLEPNGTLLVGNQRLVPHGFFQCAGR